MEQAREGTLRARLAVGSRPPAGTTDAILAIVERFQCLELFWNFCGHHRLIVRQGPQISGGIAMSNAKSSSEQDYAQLEAEFAKLRTDVASLAEAVRDVATSEAKGVSDALLNGLDGAAKQARRASKRVRKEALDAADTFQTSIEEHPISSILIALGVGVVVGMIMRR
jgi:ElaB/YqjD/DUF883 family membrane-anchored ribosome-binding protein